MASLPTPQAPVLAPPLPPNTFPGQLPFATKNPNDNSPGVTSNDQAALYPPVPEQLLPIVIGDSGTMRYGGFFHEDYEDKWADNFERVEIVEQMRRGDATVAQLLKACKAPILAAEWDIKIESDDPRQQEINDFVKENIFGMKRTWKNFLRQALTYLDFGFSVFEIIWEQKDGKFWIKDLAPRIQHSILRWKLSDGSRGVVQILRTDEALNYYAEIPINKCVVFTNDMEGDDITGIPLLRYAFKHWFLKNNLYQIAAISAERFGIGIPVFKMPVGAGPQDQKAAESLAANIRASEISNIVIPNTWDIQILVPAGRSTAGEDIKDQIEHHDRMILNAGLAGFLGLGTTDTGSFALEKGHEGFFLTHVEDRVSYLAEEYTNQVIKRLVDLNFGEQEIYPKLCYTHVGKEDKTAMATWIKALVDSGMLKPDPDTMEWVRDNFKIVPFSEEQKAMMEADEIDAQIAALQPPAPEPEEGSPEEESQETPEEEDQEDSNQ